MKLIHAFIFIALVLIVSCDITSEGTFTEFSRTYSPDSSKYLLNYDYVQGAWDGGRTSFTTVLNRTDSFEQGKYYSFSSHDIDEMYWKGNDTIIVAEKFTEFISRGKSNLTDTVLNGVVIKVIQKDLIDTSYSRKIIYHEASPNKKYVLIVYRYVKPTNGNYFLNISVIKSGDSIPEYGNFYISRFNFDCFNDIRWGKANILDIKVSSNCYYAFEDYLVKIRPAVKYNVEIDDTIHGNIQSWGDIR